MRAIFGVSLVTVIGIGAILGALTCQTDREARRYIRWSQEERARNVEAARRWNQQHDRVEAARRWNQQHDRANPSSRPMESK